MIDGDPFLPERIPPRGSCCSRPLADNRPRYGYASGVLNAFIHEKREKRAWPVFPVVAVMISGIRLGKTMVDINDLSYRFYESPIVELFNEIRSSAVPRIDVPEALAERLAEYLRRAEQFCTQEWDSSHPVLYRARLNDYGQLKPYARKDMGAPKAHIASAGRAQLAGSAVLYVANSPPTAIAEVRPEVDEYATIGTFRLKPKTSLRVLDLTRFSPEAFLSSRGLIDLMNLSRFAFSAPIHSKTPKRYHAQAYFVQMIRDLKYDGIGYKSAVYPNGRCYAFFDEEKFKCTSTSLHQVKSVLIVSERVKYSSLEKRSVDLKDAEMRLGKRGPKRQSGN